MNNNDVFDHIEKHLGFRPDDHPFWSYLCKDAEINPMSFNSFFDWFSSIYPALDLRAPSFEDVSNAFCSRLLLYSIEKMNANPIWEKRLEKLFQQWTHCGMREIPKHYFEPLLEPLKKLLNSVNGFHYVTVLNMVYRSPQLWESFRDRILYDVNAQKDVHCPYGSRDSYKYLIHRYEPHLTEVYADQDLKNLYQSMCRGDYIVAHTFIDLKKLLIGYHNNALAWNTALEIFSDISIFMQDSWLEMLDPFLSIELDPKDQNAWRFWNRLHECTEKDASGKKLMVSLMSAKKEMHQAYENSWQIVDALQEGDARYAYAATLNYDSMSVLPLPEMGV